MKIVLVFLGVAITTVCTSPSHKEALSTIEAINSKSESWKAGLSLVGRLNKEAFKRRLGARLTSGQNAYRKRVKAADNIPDSFDARTAWPNCASIASIKNQGDCGSCWAVAGASAASDRLCIGSNYQIQVNLSAENLMSCCTDCAPDGGCEGGDINAAWNYIQNTGIVTGGDYGSGEGCQPYEISPDAENPSSPPCESSCTNSDYGTDYNDDIYQGYSHYSLPNDVSQIQTDLMNNGPLDTGFTVYDDFQYYQSGVYRRTTDKTDNKGHAVRVIGWGTDSDSGLDYWLIANSWDRSWGENGLFRMIRGTNDCGLEDNFAGGLINGQSS